MKIRQLILGTASLLLAFNANATPVYSELGSGSSQFYTADWFYNTISCVPGEPCEGAGENFIFRVDDSQLNGEASGGALNSINGQLALQSAGDFGVVVDIVGGTLGGGEPWHLDFQLRQTDSMGTLLFEPLPEGRPQVQDNQLQLVLWGPQMQPYLVTATGLNNPIAMFQPFLSGQVRPEGPVDVPAPASLLLLGIGLLLQIMGRKLSSRRRDSQLA